MMRILVNKTYPSSLSNAARITAAESVVMVGFMSFGMPMLSTIAYVVDATLSAVCGRPKGTTPIDLHTKFHFSSM